MHNQRNYALQQKVVSNIYNSIMLEQLQNNFMRHGKRSTAGKIIFNALFFLKQYTSKNPRYLFHKLVYHYRFPLILIKVRKSGRSYPLPFLIAQQKQFNSFFTMLAAVTVRSKKGSAQVLADEVLSSFNLKKKSLIIKKTEELSQIMVNNRAYLHFRWSKRF